MAGGPGGTGDGIQSESLLWAIIMSAFAGASSQYTTLLVWKTNSSGFFYLLLAFGGILFGYVNPIIASAQLPPSESGEIGMIQERLEESLQWKIGW